MRLADFIGQAEATKFFNELDKDREFFKKRAISQSQSHKAPYKCPICNGKGNVPQGFYSIDRNRITIGTNPLQCRSCSGSGIIWG